MAESKTLAPAAPCSLCDEDNAVKYCTDCGKDLCTRCARAHGRVQATGHHTLTLIGSKALSGIRPNTKQGFCSEHTSNPLCVICQDCLCAVCDACADKDHKNHKLLRSNLNATVLQSVSAQKVSEFMDVLQKLEKRKDGSPVKLELYKTARDMVTSWKDHLWKIVEQDSGTLLNEIEKEIKRQEILLSDINSNLKAAVKTTEKHMSLLSNAGNIDDPAILMANIQVSDQIIGKAKTLLREIESTRKTYTIDDLLPFRNELTNVEKRLHTFFTKTKLADEALTDITTYPAARIHNYSTMTKSDECHIGKHKDNWPLRISETGERNSKKVVVYFYNTQDICVYNMDSKQKTKFKCKKKIRAMASLTDDIHVIVDSDNNSNVHLLDANFCKLATLNKDKGTVFEPRGVCRVSADSFILSENHQNINKMRLVEVTVSHNNTFSKRQMCTVDVHDDLGCLALHGDRKYITLRTSRYNIHTVNLITGKLTKLELRSHIIQGGYITYICVDIDDQILVGNFMPPPGDCIGKIHQTTSTKYERELTNMESKGDVGGISLRSDKVVTVFGEYISFYNKYLVDYGDNIGGTSCN